MYPRTGWDWVFAVGLVVTTFSYVGVQIYRSGKR